MRRYELTYIIHPDTNPDEVSTLMEQVESWVSAGDGTIQKVSDWGRRRMAYPIENQREGHYVHLEVDIEPENVKQIERNLTLNEQVLRHLMVRAED